MRTENHTNMSPLGQAVYDRATERGLSLHEVGQLLDWPTRRIYDVVRAGSVRVSWAAALADLLEMDLRRLVALDARSDRRRA